MNKIKLTSTWYLISFMSISLYVKLALRLFCSSCCLLDNSFMSLKLLVTFPVFTLAILDLELAFSLSFVKISKYD